MKACIFCEIATKKSPAHIVWEDKNHLAFLSIYPNTEGVTVVIPKKHHSSYIFDVPEKVMINLLKSAKKVANKIDAAFQDVGRTALVFEGFGIDHLHAKLFPMHGTKSNTWENRPSKINKYFQIYEGYISSNDSDRANDNVLSELANKIRKTNEIN